MNQVGRILLRLLARLQVSGMENIPSGGPVILAGNHLSYLEPMLMAAYPRRPVELIGAGDMPFVGFIGKIVALYGFIPVNRGNLDRVALNQALGVLEQGGVLGIFPEGGVWNPGHMKAQVGVSWLSHKTGAPVVPIGFSGFQGSLSKALKLKRPHLQMKVGRLIPAFSFENDDRVIKTVYQDYADMVLKQIKALVDPQDFLSLPEKIEYCLQVSEERTDSAIEKVEISGSDALAQFLFTPVMLDSMATNLKKPVQPLFPEEQPRWNQQFSSAIHAAINVLQENAGFFTYRMGMERGHQAEKALHELADLLARAYKSQKTVVLKARAHLQYSDGRVEEKTHEYRILPDPV